MTAAVRTTCPYCGVGCGILASTAADGGVTIAGDTEHSANFGRLCSKGSALGETLSLDDRLLHPIIRGERTTWDAALDLVAGRFKDAIAAHGPDSVAFYVSGQLLTEDYYVANKLMKGFIGSANIDTNSRLCMASSVAGHKRAFGSDTVPGVYEDLELADLVVLVGSNLAWCHPVLFQRLAAARKSRGTKIVVIDPRRTDTCEIADLHLSLAPGSDVALFNGLLTYLADSGAFDKPYIDAHTNGLPEALDTATSLGHARIANLTGLEPASITAFYQLFSQTHRTVTVYSQGVNQSSAGTDKVNAIINCHLATGRIGKPGTGPFSVTGQPNAMGGREVGGMANMLAAHMELGDAGHRQIVQEFWRSPRIASTPGLKAVDMFKAVGDGRIKALWIMATNPADSMPQADDVRAAIEACPFVVVSDVTRHTDTTAIADVLLPSLAWGEKDGTVTNSERRISRQRAFLPAPGEAKADWWQLAEVARRMGFSNAFAYSGAAGIFAEHARLSAANNNGTRDFDIGAFGQVKDDDYAALTPFQWPRGAGEIAKAASAKRFFGDGGYFTPDRRARFVATPYRTPASAASPDFPLILNTGRIRDQWHTMTRTAKSARLMGQAGEPLVEIHPADAARLGLQPAALASIESTHGKAILRVLISERQRPGSVFVPMHWNDQFAGLARIDATVGSHVDPISGQPELKHTPVRVTPYAAAWYGFMISTRLPRADAAEYWAIARTKAGWRMELAGRRCPQDWTELARRLFTSGGLADDSIVTSRDRATGLYRFATFVENRLSAALFVAPVPVSAARDYLASQLGLAFDSAAARQGVLSGRAPLDRPDPGPTVCTCFEVGRNQITNAVAAGGLATVEEVGAATSAGTNCGSCRTEIGRLIIGTRAGTHTPAN